MADMTPIIRRLSLVFLLLIVILGTAGHLFSSAANTSHITQEANCPIHSGMAQPERIQPYTHQPAMMIAEALDGTHDFDLDTKISHPPTI